MISPLMEDEISRIVRDEIAQDEARRIKQESGAAVADGRMTLDFDVARLNDMTALDQVVCA